MTRCQFRAQCTQPQLCVLTPHRLAMHSMINEQEVWPDLYPNLWSQNYCYTDLHNLKADLRPIALSTTSAKHVAVARSVHTVQRVTKSTVDVEIDHAVAGIVTEISREIAECVIEHARILQVAHTTSRSTLRPGAGSGATRLSTQHWHGSRRLLCLRLSRLLLDAGGCCVVGRRVGLWHREASSVARCLSLAWRSTLSRCHASAGKLQICCVKVHALGKLEI